jgi:DNA-directed RNA polymerase specialized sigma24 family protein
VHGAEGGGAGEAIRVTLDASHGRKPTCEEEIIALESVMHKLEDMSPRQARVVEYRFFGSMSVEEVARALDVSKSVVERDWRAARAWLSLELGRGDNGDLQFTGQ